MINILHAIDTTGPGGAETVFIDLLGRLDSSRYKPLVVIRGRGWVYDELCRRGITPYIVDAKGSFNLKYLYNLIRIIRKERIDIIQSHLFGSNVYCCLAGLLSRTPVIATFHGSVDFSGECMLGVKFRIIDAIAKRVVVVSDALKSQMLDKVQLNPDKLKIIYNGVDVTQYQPNRNDTLRKECSFAENDIIVGSIGNIRRPKDYGSLIRAAEIVVKKEPGIKFIIVGENKNDLYKELLELTQTLKLDNNVFFIGFRSDIAEVLNGFDIFLLSSASEGFSISTIEAMACGVPVIVTKSGGPEEIVSNKHDGLIVEVKSPAEIASAILKLVDDQELYNHLALNALNTVKSRFTIGAMVAAYDEIYTDVI